MGSNIFNAESLKKIPKIRKVFLQAAVWILIAELVLGATIILTGSWNSAIGKIQATFLILAANMFVGVNNLIRIEKNDKTTQVFALISLIGNFFATVLGILLVWEAIPSTWQETVVMGSSKYSYNYTVNHPTLYSTMALLASYAAAAGFWISNVRAIQETIKVVRPLKITATVCVIYLWIFFTVISLMALAGSNLEEIETPSRLAALAVLAFIITALAALIISKTNAKKQSGAISQQPSPKTEAELRAEIEEQVRREMIEKEVRAKIAQEQEQAQTDELGSNPDGGQK